MPDEIDAGDQQHQPDDRHQQAEESREDVDVAGNDRGGGRRQSLRRDSRRGTPARAPRRSRSSSAFACATRDAGLQPSAHDQPHASREVSIDALRRGVASCMAEIGTHASLLHDGRALETFGGATPTTVNGLPLSATVWPIDAGVAAEPPLPQLVAEHDHGMAARRALVVGVHEQPAEMRARAEHRK